MSFPCVLLLLPLIGTSMCMQLKDLPKANDANVLHFEANKELQLPSQVDNEQDTRDNRVVCPDGGYCADSNTCCLMNTGRYGCCPFPYAVCCSDRAHCCPNGYRCNGSAGTCYRDTDVVTWQAKVAAKPVKDKVTCDDGSECSSGNTCCKLASGQYGCCSQEQDTRENIVCPDGGTCPDGNTCCLMNQGQYGCCPYPSAVCCSDRAHCCPNGFRCNVSTGTCLRGTDVVTWQAKVAAKTVNDKVTCDDGSECSSGNTCCKLASGQYGCCSKEQVSSENIVCPDGGTCPNGNTCCLMSTGRYGCCSFSYATCCSDHVHCCPYGYRCNLSAGTCYKGTDVVMWQTKIAAEPVKDKVTCDDGSECSSGNACCKLASGQYGCCSLEQQVSRENIVCPDGGYCSDGNTCCQLSLGQYGCCPFPSAVCCSDHAHCCPNGYRCNLSAGTCIRGTDIVNWQTKMPAKPVREKVTCEDDSECPFSNTCCKLASGQYGCCPVVQAECCSDDIHCCPNGYSCDVNAGTCIKGTDALAWLTKTPAKHKKRL